MLYVNKRENCDVEYTLYIFAINVRPLLYIALITQPSSLEIIRAR